MDNNPTTNDTSRSPTNSVSLTDNLITVEEIDCEIQAFNEFSDYYKSIQFDILSRRFQRAVDDLTKCKEIIKQYHEVKSE